MNPPPLPHNRQKEFSESISIRWFLLGFLFVLLALGGVTYLAATSSPSAELDYDLLAIEIRHGTVQDLTISGTELTGDFNDIRQSYDGQIRGRILRKRRQTGVIVHRDHPRRRAREPDRTRGGASALNHRGVNTT